MDGNLLLAMVFQNGRKVFKKKTKQGIWKTFLTHFYESGDFAAEKRGF
ncbi:MAG: hypothetical protein ACI4LZ_06765 [Anaerovoracaceae bacterium]